MQATILRVVMCALSSLFTLLPAAALGFVSINSEAGTITVGIATMLTAVIASLGISGGIFAKWGIKPEVWLPSLMRVITYALSGVASLLPAAALGFVVINPTASTITIDIDAAVTAVLAALGVSGGIFAKWGIKR